MLSWGFTIYIFTIYDLLFLRDFSLVARRVCEAAHTAEAYIRTRLVLIFRRAPGRTDIGLRILPRTTTHALLLHTVGILFGGVVTQLGIDVVHRIDTGLSIDGARPLCHVACHIVEAVAVRGIDAHTTCYQVTVLGIVSIVWLEVGKETTLAAGHILIIPRELILVLTTRYSVRQ